MALVVQLSKNQFAQAAKIARLAELELIMLERGAASLPPSFADGGRKLGQIELRFAHRMAPAKVGNERFRIRMNFRLAGSLANAKSSIKPILNVAAIFVAEYVLPKEARVTSEEIQSFADANGVMTCWPYWREYVQSNVGRMGLPPLTIPFLKVQPKQRDGARLIEKK